MELTLEILLYFIRAMHPIIWKQDKSGHTYVGIKQFFKEDTEVSADYLYICEWKELWKCRAFVSSYMTVLATGSVVLTNGNEENNEFTKEQLEEIPCNLILVDSQFKAPYILNQMISIFSRMANWDKTMHIAALQGKSLQELLDISEDILEHPVLVFDASFDVLAYTKSVPSGNEFFMETVKRGYSDSKVMGQVKKQKLLSKLQNGEPLVAPAAGDASKINIYLSFYSGQKLLGYAAVFYDDTQPEAGYLDVLKYFTENINFCMKRDYEKQRYGQMMYETFLIHLMNPEGISKKQLDEQLANIGDLGKNGRFVLGVINFVKEEKLPMAFVAKMLQAEMWDVKLFIYEEQICLLKIMDKEKIETPVLVEREMKNLKRLLSNYEYRLGVSHVFHDILDLRYAYIQAKAALHFGQLDGKVYCVYSDYYYHHMFACLEEKLPIESLKSEIYLQLQEYDRRNRTQYTKMIVTYLENDCNATHTAEKLFVHRNTVRNAIQFVEDRWKIDMNDIEEKKRFVISHLIDCYKNQSR